MTSSNVQSSKIEEIDTIVLDSFVKKFNSKYDEGLLSEQKTLLNYYIASFSDNSLSLKTFLNEELSRLKKCLVESLGTDEIENDDEMINKTKSIIEKLESFYKKEVDENVLLTVLKTQKLVKEIFEDGSKN